MSYDPHAWERRARAKQRDLDTVIRSLDATITSLDVLAAHLRGLRTLINPREKQ